MTVLYSSHVLDLLRAALPASGPLPADSSAGPRAAGHHADSVACASVWLKAMAPRAALLALVRALNRLPAAPLRCTEEQLRLSLARAQPPQPQGTAEARRAARFTGRTGRILVAMDALAGLLVAAGLITAQAAVAERLTGLVHALLAPSVAAAVQLVRWLQANPAGMKLNRPLCAVLGTLFLFCLDLWQDFLHASLAFVAF